MAHLLTTTYRTRDRARRETGMALLGAAGLTLTAGAAALFPGLPRLFAVPAAAVLLLFVLAKLLQADEYRQKARREDQLLSRLVAHLPDRWYVLGDLQVEPSWQEPVQIWAVVVGPGGLAVIQPCAEAGTVTPFGHLWMVERSGRVRTIPSPAAQASTAVEALREVLGTETISVEPVVALTDLNSVFHKAETGAHVVGAPKLAAGLQRRLGGRRQVWDPLQLAAYLTHYHRQE